MNRVFDEPQRALLRSMLNRIVPASDRLPGAGDLNVGASIEHALADSPRLRRLFLDGLRDVQLATTAEFVDLDPEGQTQVLESVERASPRFFATLVEYTYRGYYTMPDVLRAIGGEARPPQPLGYELPVFDPALLDRQRQRAPFWRRTT